MKFQVHPMVLQSLVVAKGLDIPERAIMPEYSFLSVSPPRSTLPHLALDAG